MSPYKVLMAFSLEIMWVGLFKRNHTRFSNRYYAVKVINVIGLLFVFTNRLNEIEGN